MDVSNPLVCPNLTLEDIGRLAIHASHDALVVGASYILVDAIVDTTEIAHLGDMNGLDDPHAHALAKPGVVHNHAILKDTQRQHLLGRLVRHDVSLR
eukprot:CAMPEP_0116829738 /NCGR_PEP_ID=MMETSP0418-20121206/4381_1 /TAXON_ID=1158023 /ORGANISM="Astrosyne radiata, Strain 13vi08-1A" /LENGTH=96 /DNA_ID=CAMNT_0004458777 /DNA_START=332 /DNA_END=618 /DNA_ORIENTATION=+